MSKDLFDDLVAACHEAIEHERGNIKLKSNIVSVSDDELEINQLIFHKIAGLSKPDKQRIVRYADELLQASNG